MSEWPRFRVTEKVGRLVAGGNNPGAGSVVRRRPGRAVDLAMERGEIVPIPDEAEAHKGAESE